MPRLMFAIALLVAALAAPVAAQKDGTTPAAPTPEATPSAGAAPVVKDLFPAVRQVYAQIVAQFGVKPEDVVPLSEFRAKLPDGCLGAPTPDEMCAMMITEGYRATFSTPVGQFEVRTPLNGNFFRIAQPLPLAPNTVPLLIYQAEGGIAGLCYRFVVAQDGRFVVLSCRGMEQTALASGTLPDAVQAQITQLAAQYGTFQWQFTPAGSADMIVGSYWFVGSGTGQPDAQAQSDLNDHLYSLLTTPTSRTTSTQEATVEATAADVTATAQAQ